MLMVEGAPPALTGRNVAGVAYLSLVGTALAFVFWFNGIRRLPAAAPPLLGLAAPVTGAVMGWIVLGQALSPLQLSGFVVTLSAIAYGTSLHGPVTVPSERSMASAPPPLVGSLASHVDGRMGGWSPREGTIIVQCSARSTASSGPSAWTSPR